MASTTISPERQTAPLSNRRALNRRLRNKMNDHYQSLLCRLQALGFGDDGQFRSIGITSCMRREGVSTVAGNLAHQAAISGQSRVLIVDANIAHPSQHKLFTANQTPGLSSVLAGDATPNECVQDSSIDGLAVVAAGNDLAFTGSNFQPMQVLKILDEIGDRFDLIIVDLPAVSVPTNQAALLAGLDGLLVVIEAERTVNSRADRDLKLLKETGAKMLGIVFNKYRSYIPRWFARNE